MRSLNRRMSRVYSAALATLLTWNLSTEDSAAQQPAEPTPPEAAPAEPTPAPVTPTPTDSAEAEDPADALAPAATDEPVDPEPSAQDSEAAASAEAGATTDGDLDAEAKAAEAALLAAKEEAEAEAAASALLGTEDDLEETEIDAYKLNFYGFVDFLYSQPIKTYNFYFPYSSFAVGRLNLYTAAELGDNWRTLLETRFTYLPHGSVEAVGPGAAPAGTAVFPATVERVNNHVADYIDVDRPIRWGGIVIERAWLEKTYESWLNIRMGHWLTPYGIWNVDHGSPVIIGVRRPFIVGESMFPESQSGVQLHGSVGFDALRVGYAATVSNGRGPADVYRDFNKNKAVGGRLYGSYDSRMLGLMTLGVSSYFGRYTERGEEFVFTPEGEFQVNRPILGEFDELSLAADFKWTKGGFLLQSEAITRDVTYDDARRPFYPPGFVPSASYEADSRAFGAYGLMGYRFEFLGTMPWVGWEYYDPLGTGITAAAFWGGFNFRPTPRVVLKAQYTYSYFPEDDNAFQNLHFNNVDLQAAWSF